jgi:flagellar hook-associated protein 3 FlgL
VSGSPQAGDQFAVTANTHQNQNVLETLSQLRAALDTPATGAGNTALEGSSASAVANLASAREQVDITRGSIGARGNSLEIQRQENTSLGLANKTTQDAIGNTDMVAGGDHAGTASGRLQLASAQTSAEPVQQM